jgi:hypothetical protein
MFKKRNALSLLLVFVMLFTSTSVFANTPETNEQTIVHDDIVDVKYNNYKHIRTATVYEKDGTITIIGVNDTTGEVTHNGKVISSVRKINEEEQNEPFITTSSNWGDPNTTVKTLAFGAASAAVITATLQFFYGIPGETASYIAGLIFTGGGLLYLKEVIKLNYVDYAPKVGYILTQSYHLTRNASGNSLYTTTTRGSR